METKKKRKQWSLEPRKDSKMSCLLQFLCLVLSGKCRLKAFLQSLPRFFAEKV